MTRILAVGLVVVSLRSGGCGVNQEPSRATALRRAHQPRVEQSYLRRIAERVAGTDDLPATARTLAPFLKMNEKTTMSQLFRAVGVPDDDGGSGLRIYVYLLNDGSKVFVGTGGGEPIAYITYVKPDGSWKKLIEK